MNKCCFFPQIINGDNMTNLKLYNKKRNFNNTKEPVGKKEKDSKKLKFCVQHHIARKDHYDFRLEFNGAMLSWAVPKGPSYNPKDKRLAVKVEDHPLSYRKFEGTIPKGEYGAGTVMLWDEGTYIPNENITKTLKQGYLKFTLKGKRLKGAWTLIKFKDDNWLLIKEKDNIKGYTNINKLNTSIKTERTMKEIANDLDIEITNPNKIIYQRGKITKKHVIDYYQKISPRMLPYLQNRLISTVRCPNGTNNEVFFKKHFKENPNLKVKYLLSKGKKEDYYYIDDIKGLLSEAQMNSIEFHIWGSNANNYNHPNYMVFDLDPDEKLNIDKVRQGVKDLKSILDSLNLKSFLKTSGGKGYHIVVPFKEKMTWLKFRKIAKNIALLMEQKWPDKYTSNMRKSKRNNKIFIDWVRNTKGATSVAPYSLRARNKCTVSMPIKWSELDIIKPDDIDIKEALRRMKLKDPWSNY